MTVAFPSVLGLLAAALAEIIAPPQPLVPSVWMTENLFVPDGPRAGGRWDPKLTPYVADIVDALGPDAGNTMVAVRKSAQTGVSVAAIGLAGAYIDGAPCRIGYALPTIDAVQEFNREKLTPTIEQTAALSSRIRSQVSRSGLGSTVTTKPFPGGSLRLINANAAGELKSKTLKLGIGDEVDEWADDLDGQGDPWDLFQARFISFHATGDYRILALSTPTLLGASRIDTLHSRGDQRRWQIDCPQCAEGLFLEFGNLRFAKKPPYRAHYVAPCCGRPIEHHEKAALVRSGRFVATNSEGLYPSFHVDALISQLTTWDKIAEAYLLAEGNEQKMKSFFNNVLGLPYEIKGDAPDHVRLLERRDDYEEGVIPPLGLLLVAGADVQHSGIWVEIVAFSPDRQSWSVSARFLEGDTTDPQAGAFLKLAAVYDERFVDAFGNSRPIDAMAVDAGDGGRANQVYAFARGRHRAYAIKGMPGWNRPAIGTPTDVAITLKGAKLKGRSRVWPVGGWSLKGEFYSNLRKEGRKAGQEIDPPGYCHFGQHNDLPYFKQITAEYLAEQTVRGRTTRVWKETGPNHLLDARIYAMAMAEHLGLTRKTREEWQALARLYSVPVDTGELFVAPVIAVERETPPSTEIAAAFAKAMEPKKSAPPRRQSRFAKLGKR
ncbi:terminase [Kaistia algarum]|uniref:phage terminase large subunit family protein n=1 Tax=Kaistia algarum TaxID=2083279 RepID=UPI000CE86A11|nr:terminase gpA endonuclease subunit [Kaistia algarum]MCX5513431.1 phage terminase large subunit family protein [Kaistia algarum]PPE77437.1 terminase [Kaistia algarum]